MALFRAITITNGLYSVYDSDRSHVNQNKLKRPLPHDQESMEEEEEVNTFTKFIKNKLQ